MSSDPLPAIVNLLKELGEKFCHLYCANEDGVSNDKESSQSNPMMEMAKTRLKISNKLFYTFLESILKDELNRKSSKDIEIFLSNQIFIRTLFVCCVELVLRSYNDRRRYPWSLAVGDVSAYHFMKVSRYVICKILFLYLFSICFVCFI